MPLLISVLVVVRYVLILVLERPPAIEVVPEVVELLHVLFLALVISQLWDRLCLAEAPLGDKDGIPQLEEVALLCLLLGGRFNVSGLVYRIKLTSFDGVKEDLGGFLYAFEKGVVFGGASGCFFVRMMAKNLFAVCAFDLGFCSLVAVLRETENGVMILPLE